jgi:hypothetical protein
MRRFLIASCLLCATGALVGACALNCDQSGCDAGELPVDNASIDTGIAGVAFSESDVVANGCQECTLSQGTLRVWESAAPVESQDDAVALLAQGEADVEIMIDERYEQALDPGHYLVCVGSEDEDRTCAALALATGDVYTVHARFVFGPSSLVLFRPGDDDPSEDGIYEVSPSDLP